ncbi:MAG: BLUF domain-containing protein [Streptosporangiaceae bacterium]
MHRLGYHSQALVSGPAVFDALYAQAASLNAQAGITGALLYMDGRWAQILEGDQAVITSLYDRITDDDKADVPLARIVAATVTADCDTRIRQLRALAQAAREPLSDTSARPAPGRTRPADASGRGGIPPDQGRPPPD